MFRGFRRGDREFYTRYSVDEAGIQLRYKLFDPVLDERSRRRFAAAEAKAAGFGGIAAVAHATGMVRCTIIRGLGELALGIGDHRIEEL